MTRAIFISDLHGSKEKYSFLFEQILLYKPEVVFIGGDILPHFEGYRDSASIGGEDFIYDYLVVELQRIRDILGDEYPRIFIIPGNDDSRASETSFLDISSSRLISYINQRIVRFKEYLILGYAFVPPTPFLNKDWEKYDVSRFDDVGCIPPDAGYRSIPVSEYEARYSTIKDDLQEMMEGLEKEKTVLLMHSPPYQTKLDRAALDGKFVDHVPLDVHIGSIAIKRLLEKYKFHLSLHGHVHESTRITGAWRDTVGDNIAFQGASERKELMLIRFDLDNPDKAEMI
jgi:Icc-related predicted phosphoesterase